MTVFCMLFFCADVMSLSKKKKKGDSKILKLMTYNLKYASRTYKPKWEVRRKMQVDMIRKYNPDIIGTQEGLKEQIDYLMDKLPEYVVVGEGRKGGDDDEHMAIFYKKDKFRLRELRSFQLSETPEIIGSGPEVNPRMVTWARFALITRLGKKETSPYRSDYRGRWKNTEEFYFFNTHFFNGKKGAADRLKASKLILKRIKALNLLGERVSGRPLFLMGDFNCKPGSAPYRVLVVGKDPNDPDLLHDTIKKGRDIDWILYRGKVKVLKYEEVDYNKKGIYPSDHKPIYVEFQITNK